MVLAYASAHEVGHLLLRTQAHALRGPMKGAWDRSDDQAIAQNDFRFNTLNALAQKAH